MADRKPADKAAGTEGDGEKRRDTPASVTGSAPAQPDAAEADEAVDLGSELSFPASDPPAYMGSFAITGAPPKRESTEPETGPDDETPPGKTPAGKTPVAR